ncbi:MAG: PQQ-binding-like beta-propeller repeat protein [Fibrobacteres bacterium]|nr:PQQ-binding-like beta-propeller repeat protein [Fibrobacterota bacterium]
MNMNEENRQSEQVIKELLNSVLKTDKKTHNSFYEKGLFLLEQEKRGSRFRNRLLFAAAAVIAVAFTIYNIPGKTAPQAEGWLFVAGDAGNSRVVESELVSTTTSSTELAWRAEVKSATGAYKPLAWNGLIIAGKGYGKGGGLIAFDAVTGELKWEQSFSSGDLFKNRRFPDRCILGNRLYMTDGEVCHVVNPLTGDKLGTFAPLKGEGWSYLSASGTSLLGLSKDGRTLFSINKDDGSLQWSQKLPSPSFVPALLNNTLFCQTDNGNVTAFNSANGSIIWTSQDSKLDGKAFLQAKGKHLCVITENDRIALLSTLTGKMLWETDHDGVFNKGAAISDSIVYLTGGNEAVYANTGEPVWKIDGTAGEKAICASPTLINGRVIASSAIERGSISIIDNDGSVISSMQALDSRACDGAIILGNRIFTVGSGHVVAYGG